MISEAWIPDDWETPDAIARAMAELILPTDQIILEPAIGSGQIAKFIPRNRQVCGVDIKRDRIQHAGIQIGYNTWALCCEDFLAASWGSVFHLIITNPPFSQAIAFIERSLQLLDPTYLHSRLLFLLPMDFFNSVARNDALEAMDCRIYQRHRIRNRVAYIRNGEQIKGRQVYDCIYDIRPGRDGDARPESVIRF